ncbi:MAG: hypothetical protein JF628_04390 [Sphingomonas sp.]|nr:hypothetical protein [Sphingomonas sp.]
MPLLDQEVGTLERLDRLGLIPRTRLLEMQRQRHAEIGDRGIAVAERSRGISDAAKFSQQVREARDHALQEALGDLTKSGATAEGWYYNLIFVEKK